MVNFVVTTLTGVISLGLSGYTLLNISTLTFLYLQSTIVFVAIWLAFERLLFARTGGHRTLYDLLAGWCTFSGVAYVHRLFFKYLPALAKQGAILALTFTYRYIAGAAGLLGEVLTSWVNTLVNLVSRPSRNRQRDEESRDGSTRRNSPTCMFTAEDGSRSLGINVASEKYKLSDLGKGMEDATHEDKLLVVNTLAPVEIASPPSAGGSSRVLSDEPASETKEGNVEPAGPATPRNAKFRAVARRVITVSSNNPVLILICVSAGHSGIQANPASLSYQIHALPLCPRISKPARLEQTPARPQPYAKSRPYAPHPPLQPNAQ
jgi:hypothetical protein